MKKLKVFAVGVALAALLAGYPLKSSATITNTSSETVTALGDTATVNFTIGFYFTDNSQVQVTLVDNSTTPITRTILTYGAGAGQFTVSGGNPGTTVVMGTAPTTTQNLVIDRIIPFTQTVHYDPYSAFPSSSHETQMDKLVMMLQGMQTTVNAAAAGTLFPQMATGSILIGNGNGVGAAQTMSGDVTIGPTGVTAIGASKVTNTMLAGSIARSKVAAGTTNAIVINDGSGNLSNLASNSSFGFSPVTNGSGSFTTMPIYAAYDIVNLGLTATVGTSTLTIGLRTATGALPSSSSPVRIGFRSSTATSGVISAITATGASTVSFPNGATLGQVSALSEFTYVYAQNNAGTIQLCASTNNSFDQGTLQTTTVADATATSRGVLYCAAAGTAVPVRLIGRIRSSQTVAGSWSTSPTEVTVYPFFGLSAPLGSIPGSRAQPNGEIVVRAKVLSCSSSTCTVDTQSGEVSSVTRSGTGTYVVNIYTGVFASNPTCVASSHTNSSRVAQATPASTTAVNVTTTVSSSGSGEDNAFSIICMGPR